MFKRLFRVGALLILLAAAAAAQPALPSMSPEKKVEAMLKIIQDQALESPSQSALVQGAFQALNRRFAEVPASEDRAGLARAVKLLSGRYDPNSVEQTAVSGMLTVLGDRYSQYLTARQYFAAVKGSRAERSGVGVLMTPQGDSLTVIEVLPDSPAQAAGLTRGDRLLAVEGRSTRGMTVAEARQFLNAPGSTPVELQIQTGQANPRNLSIALTSLPSPRVTSRPLTHPDRKLGYLKIPSFSRDTPKQLDAELAKLGQVDGIILDLRNNPGGQVDAAVEVCSRFLPQGSTVVTARYRNRQAQVYRTGHKPVAQVPLVVLVNEHSASAAEITAAALQKLGGAQLVGQTTYGKGTIQDFVRLPDLSSLKLTVAQYETAAGERLEGRGISPDLQVAWPSPDPQDLQLEAALRSLNALASRGRPAN